MSVPFCFRRAVLLDKSSFLGPDSFGANGADGGFPFLEEHRDPPAGKFTPTSASGCSPRQLPNQAAIPENVRVATFVFSPRAQTFTSGIGRVAEWQSDGSQHSGLKRIDGPGAGVASQRRATRV